MKKMILTLLGSGLAVWMLSGCGKIDLKLPLFSERNITDRQLTVSTCDFNSTMTRITKTEIMVSLEHERIQDLTVALRSPEGTVVTLMKKIVTERNGDFYVLFKMDADLPIEHYGYTSDDDETEYVPKDSLDAFNGENPNGTWKLLIVDDKAGATGIFHTGMLFLDGE